MNDILAWAQEKLNDTTLKIDDFKDHAKVLKLLEIFGNSIGKPPSIKLKQKANIFQKRFEATEVLKYANTLGIVVDLDNSLFDDEKKVGFLLNDIRKKIDPKQLNSKQKTKSVQIPLVRANNIKIEIQNKIDEQKKKTEMIQNILNYSIADDDLLEESKNFIEKQEIARKEKEEFEIFADKTLQEIDGLIVKLNQEISLIELKKDFIKERDSIIEKFDKIINRIEKNVVRKVEVINEINKSEDALKASDAEEHINNTENEIEDLENNEIIQPYIDDIDGLSNKIEQVKEKLTEIYTTKIQDYYNKSKDLIETANLSLSKTYSMELNEKYSTLLERIRNIKITIEKTRERNFQLNDTVTRIEILEKRIETIEKDPRTDFNKVPFSTSTFEIALIMKDIQNQEKYIKSIKSDIERQIKETNDIISNNNLSQDHSEYRIFSLQQQLESNEQRLKDYTIHVKKAKGHAIINEFIKSNDPNYHRNSLDKISKQIEGYKSTPQIISFKDKLKEAMNEFNQIKKSLNDIYQCIKNIINRIIEIGKRYEINIDEYCLSYYNVDTLCSAKNDELIKIQQQLSQKVFDELLQKISTTAEECTIALNEETQITEPLVTKMDELRNLIKESNDLDLLNIVNPESRKNAIEIIHNAHKIESRYSTFLCKPNIPQLPEMIQIKARIFDEPEKRYLIRKDADADKTCKLIRNELGIKNDLIAKINDIVIDRTRPLISSINESDVVTFVTKKQESIIHVPLVTQEPQTGNNWRIFSSTSSEMMTKGIVMNLIDYYQADQIKEIIKCEILSITTSIPHDSDFYIYLPTGIPFEKGTLGQYIEAFPEAKHNIYVVVSNKMPADIINEDVDKIMDISDSRNVRAYSPTSIASKNSLSSIASFLGYIHYNGDLTNELIYGLSKKVPFAPLINGLVMISQNKELKFKEIIQITAPLHTLLADAYSYVRKEDLFKMIPDFLPYLVCGDMALPNMIYYNTSPNKIIKANTDELSHKIDNFVINKKEFYAIDMTDLGSIERIQFEYNPIPEVLKECNKKIKIFKPKSVMECMKINRPALIEEDGFIELYTGNITKDEDKSNVKKQVAYISPDDGGFIKLIDPQEGERKSKDYIADGVVCVAVDLSGSMGCTYIPGISNVEAAKKCFKMLAQKAFDFATLNWYGLVEFGRESYATKMIEIQKIPEDFKDILNEAHAYGGTPMWSAIRLSIDMLLETKKNKEACKDAPMKIILLTDGDAGDYCDNSITYRLKENGIRIDAICIGSSIPRELYYIAKYTGGYIFNPKTIEDIEDLAESEPLFDMSICKYKPFMEKYYMLSFIMFLLPCDNVDVDILSKSTEIDYSKYVSPEWIMDNYNFDDESVSEASINEEIKKFDECISIKPLINRYSITEWVILIQLSEYNNLWYALRVTFPTDYPYKAPTVRFINPPYHVNVTKFGRIYPDIKSYHQNPFNLMKYIKDVQQLLNTPFDQLRMTDLFDKFAPADSEHERTFNDEYKYQLAKANSYANGKNTPEDFC